MTDDDELWTHLRAGLASADVTPDAADAMQRHAHVRLREPPPTLAAMGRSAESLGVIGLVVAQLAWAWSVALG